MNTNALPQAFIGRDEVLRVLNKRVAALKSGYRQNVALTGQKLCGKTTILQHFLFTLDDPSFLPIYIEVLSEPFTNFAKKFVGTALVNLFKISSEESVENLDFLIAKGKRMFPKTASSICAILRLMEKKNYDEAYSLLFNLTSVIKDETQKSCIIILDEFHNLANFELKKPFVIFGKKIMVQKDTMYIVTSSQVSSIKKILREKLSLLFGNFETIVVKDFDYQKCNEFLNNKLGEIGMDRELKDFLIDFTNGRPFYIDIIVSRLKDAASELQLKCLGQSVISQVFQDLFFDTKGTLNQYFQNLLSIFLDKTHTNDYMDILIAIGEGKNRLIDIETHFSGKKGKLRKRVEELIESCVVAKNGTRFYFNDKVLKFWVKFVYNRKKYSLVTSVVDSSNLFKKDVEDLISNFIIKSGMDIYDRMKDLICSFDDEVVEIGEKRLRMPRFKRIEMKVFKEKMDFCFNAWYSSNKSWAFQFSFDRLEENSLARYIERFKENNPDSKCRILISFSNIDENSMLVVKQNKIWVWDMETLNQLLFLYKKQKILN